MSGLGKVEMSGLRYVTGNAFAPTFLADYNARFAKTPSNALDAHRPMLPSEKLDDIFTWQETRRASQSLTFNYQRC